MKWDTGICMFAHEIYDSPIIRFYSTPEQTIQMQMMLCDVQNAIVYRRVVNVPLVSFSLLPGLSITTQFDIAKNSTRFGLSTEFDVYAANFIIGVV